MDVFLIILWAINGVLNLCCKQITKLSYFLAWICLMVYLIVNAIGA